MSVRALLTPLAITVKFPTLTHFSFLFSFELLNKLFLTRYILWITFRRISNVSRCVRVSFIALFAWLNSSTRFLCWKVQICILLTSKLTIFRHWRHFYQFWVSSWEEHRGLSMRIELRFPYIIWLRCITDILTWYEYLLRFELSGLIWRSKMVSV